MKTELNKPNMLKDDRAIAGGYLIITVILIVAGIVTIVLAPMIDAMISSFNVHATRGVITEQTYDAFNFNRTMFVALPVFTLFGLLAWGIVRALERRLEGV